MIRPSLAFEVNSQCPKTKVPRKRHLSLSLHQGLARSSANPPVALLPNNRRNPMPASPVPASSSTPRLSGMPIHPPPGARSLISQRPWSFQTTGKPNPASARLREQPSNPAFPTKKAAPAKIDASCGCQTHDVATPRGLNSRSSRFSTCCSLSRRSGPGFSCLTSEMSHMMRASSSWTRAF